MKVIKEASDKILKFWGNPKIRTEDTYRLMKYVLTVDCDEGMLLHNGVTGELLLINEAEKDLINLLPSGYNSNMDEFIKKHFLVSVNYDEKKSVSQLRNIAKIMFSKKEIVSYTVLPTTACNARCFYCYESGIDHITMTEETAEQLVRYIKDKSNGKKVKINWFGGEPLLCVNRIDQIVKGLKENDVKFASTIVTNGYLFSKELASHAKEEWNLLDSQITIDGTEEIYNKTKSYVNPQENPYEKVMENIGHLLKNGVSVKIRVNLSMHNYYDAKKLIDEIADRFSERKILNPYIALIYENVGFEPVRYDKDVALELELKKQELEKLITSYGFENYRNELPCLDTIYCMADNDQAVLVNPKGELGKCEHHIFDSVFGSIYDEKRDNSVISFWKEMVEFDKCGECPIYPSCLNLKGCDDVKECAERSKFKKIENCKNDILEFFARQNKQ